MLKPLSLSLTFVAVAATAVAQPAKPKTTLAVLPLTAVGVEARVTVLMTDLLTVRVAELGSHEVLATDEINAMIGMEKVKEAAGCDNVSCAAQIAGMLGVEQMVTGNVGRLGDNLNLKLTLFDAAAMKVLKRSLKIVRNDENLFEGVVLEALSELFATDRWRAQIAAIKASASATGAQPVSAAPSDTVIRTTTALDEIGVCQKGEDWWFCEGKEEIMEGRFAELYGLRMGLPTPLDKYNTTPWWAVFGGIPLGTLGALMVVGGITGLMEPGMAFVLAGFFVTTGGVSMTVLALSNGKHGFDARRHEMNIDEARMYSELYNKAKEGGPTPSEPQAAPSTALEPHRVSPPTPSVELHFAFLGTGFGLVGSF